MPLLVNIVLHVLLAVKIESTTCYERFIGISIPKPQYQTNHKPHFQHPQVFGAMCLLTRCHQSIGDTGDIRLHQIVFQS